VKRTPSTGATLTLLGSLSLPACGDDVSATTETDTEGTSTGSPTDSSTSLTSTDDGPGTTDTGLDTSGDGPTTAGSESTGQLPPPEPADFVVTIENVSDQGLMFSPLSPGVWVNHEANADTLFQSGVADDDEGLASLAEDGDPTALAAAVAGHNGVDQVGVFDTPVGGDPGPLLPGDMYEFTFTAEPGTRLGLATMVMGSNDLFIASGPAGVSLFAGGGQVMGERDITDVLRVWDAGTEANQAPGQGPWQAVHGGSPDLGPAEIDQAVHMHATSTRAMPLGPDIAEVIVDQDMKNPALFHVSITNVSGTRGTMVTPLSSLVWATHDDTVSLFASGGAASPELRALAEDGDAMPMDTLLTGLAGVDENGMIPGPIMPGDTVEFSITPDFMLPRLSVATMVVESNDAFLAAGPEGIAMFDEGNALNTDNEMTEAFRANLTPWDAGTEANEVPGAGANQVLRQAAPDTGPEEVDDPTVHRYSDVTNDLAGPSLGGFLEVSVVELAGVYTVTLTNTSGATAFPGVFTPTLWAVHDDTVALFEPGMLASPSLELLAEEGDPTMLLGDVMGMAGVALAGVVDTPLTMGMPVVGPLMPGESYEFIVTPDAVNRFLSFIGMVVPSNDTFGAMDPAGVALLDAMGMPRLAADIEADIAASLVAWDAGTEGNQAGAAGADMAPVGMLGEGPGNGLGEVRQADEDEIWSVPEPRGLIRVIVAPVQ